MKRKKLTIEIMRDVAAQRGGICLSNRYVKYVTKLLWQCAKGHTWEATPQSIKHGTWCPTCTHNKKLTLEEMQKRAVKRGGKCLSTRYINSDTKLEWECAKGHRWNTTPSSIHRGTWCPFCAGLAKKTIEDMQKLAAQRGGICVSSNYIIIKAKLTWQCAKGHTWQATPSSIQQGTWCPHCYRANRCAYFRLT